MFNSQAPSGLHHSCSLGRKKRPGKKSPLHNVAVNPLFCDFSGKMRNFTPETASDPKEFSTNFAGAQTKDAHRKTSFLLSGEPLNLRYLRVVIINLRSANGSFFCAPTNTILPRIKHDGYFTPPPLQMLSTSNYTQRSRFI